MSLHHPAFGHRAMFALGAILALVTAPGRAATDDPRFSSTLRPAQWTESGLNKLTTDNVAVIDALVRVDKAASEYRNNNIGSTRFSERRTEHERTISGLYLLTPAQVEKLDQLVAFRVARPMAQFDTSIPAPRLNLENVTVPNRPPEIHGSVSLTYGWGKGGSVRGADSVFTYDDPARRFSLLFGYSEYRGKGDIPLYYPGDIYYRNRPVLEVPPTDR
jgi:hypothetical protein